MPYIRTTTLLLITLIFQSVVWASETIEEEPEQAKDSLITIDENSLLLNQTEILLKNEADTASKMPAPAHLTPSNNPASYGVEVAFPNQPQQSISLLGEIVEPGSMKTLDWSPQNLFEGMPAPTPVLVVNGVNQGPVLCMTGAIHGDEINSIETIRRIMHSLQPDKLAGTVIGIPIVNQMSFRRNSRYLPDRRDLNRYFPGTPNGSSASRIAYSLFHQVIRHCDALVDMHTGSFNRTNIPQLRANLNQESIKALVNQFGDIVVLHSEGSVGTLRREASSIGIPSVTLEAGEALRIQESVIGNSVQHINTVLTNMKMVKRPFFWRNPQPTYMASRWLRAEAGGIFISNREPGEKVVAGDRLGTIIDPITNKEQLIHAEFDGKIIGMALNQVVLPGYAVYHIGMDTSTVAPTDPAKTLNERAATATDSENPQTENPISNYPSSTQTDLKQEGNRSVILPDTETLDYETSNFETTESGRADTEE